MGMITTALNWFFGSGGDTLARSVEVFRVNAEEDAKRDAALSHAAMAQFAHEFTRQQRTLFDRFMDALNRVPRPALALGTLALFVSAMFNPVWFAERMTGLAQVPEPMWWLLGAVVTFYFGARHQIKGQDFQKNLVHNLARYHQVINKVASTGAKLAIQGEDNRAISDWRKLL